MVSDQDGEGSAVMALFRHGCRTTHYHGNKQNIFPNVPKLKTYWKRAWEIKAAGKSKPKVCVYSLNSMRCLSRTLFTFVIMAVYADDLQSCADFLSKLP